MYLFVKCENICFRNLFITLNFENFLKFILIMRYFLSANFGIATKLKGWRRWNKNPERKEKRQEL